MDLESLEFPHLVAAELEQILEVTGVDLELNRVQQLLERLSEVRSLKQMQTIQFK